jgi:hypothetical protein
MSLIKYPTFIICRDRVTCTSQLVDWLEKAGQEQIYLIDNDSTYEPLLEYYEKTPHTVIKMGANTGHTGIWLHGVVDKYAKDQHFIVSDPDTVPIEECPLDAVDYFRTLLDRYQDRSKVGFGMMLADIPNHYRFKQSVIEFESKYLQWGGPEPGLNFAPIDTTFALYRPGATQDISFSCRTQYPYVVRHLPWYLDSNNPGLEEEYYIANAHTRINSWNHKELPFWLGGNR